MDALIAVAVSPPPKSLRPGPRRIPGLFDVPAVGCRRHPADLSTLVETLIAPNRSTGAH